MASLRERIDAADDLPYEDLEIPEWGGVKVRIRGLNGTQRDAYEAKAVAIRNQGKDIELRLKNFRSNLIVQCLYDPDTDERVYADGEAGKLGRKSGTVLARLYSVAQRLSGMDEDAKEAAKGNSEAATSGSSTSD